jgi:hypothetical protein
VGEPADPPPPAEAELELADEAPAPAQARSISERALDNIERQRGGVTEVRPLPTTQTGEIALATRGEQADKAKIRDDGAATAPMQPIAAPHSFKTVAEYTPYLARWLASLTDHKAIEERWASEKLWPLADMDAVAFRRLDGMVGGRVYELEKTKR